MRTFFLWRAVAFSVLLAGLAIGFVVDRMVRHDEPVVPPVVEYNAAIAIPETSVTVGYPKAGFGGDGMMLGYADFASLTSLPQKGNLFVRPRSAGRPSVEVGVYAAQGKDLNMVLQELNAGQLPGLLAEGRYHTINGKEFFVTRRDFESDAFIVVNDEIVVIRVSGARTAASNADDAVALLETFVAHLDFACADDCTVNADPLVYVGKHQAVRIPGWYMQFNNHCGFTYQHPPDWVHEGFSRYLGSTKLLSPEDVHANAEYDRTHPQSTEGERIGLDARSLYIDCYTNAAAFIGGFDGYLEKPELSATTTLAAFFADGVVRTRHGSMTVVAMRTVGGKTAYEVLDVSTANGMTNRNTYLYLEDGRLIAVHLGQKSYEELSPVVRQVIDTVQVR